jgi:quinol monooxygenase YgiN
MYMVVTEWKPKPGMRDEFERAGRAVGNLLRKQDGVTMVEVFESGERVIAAHAYADESTYRRLIHDPEGAFAQAVAENHIEDYGDWVSTVSGETVPHD